MKYFVYMTDDPMYDALILFVSDQGPDSNGKNDHPVNFRLSILEIYPNIYITPYTTINYGLIQSGVLCSIIWRCKKCKIIR